MPDADLAQTEAILLDGSTTVEDGNWIYVGDRDGFSIVFTGIVGDTLQVWVSNTPQRAANLPSDYREFQLGSDITADGIYATALTEDNQYGWVKVKHTVAGGNAVYADLHGRKRAG